jgi:hypothetical protein
VSSSFTADPPPPLRLILRGRRRPAFPRRTPPRALGAAFRLTPITIGSGPRVSVDSSGFCTDDSSGYVPVDSAGFCADDSSGYVHPLLLLSPGVRRPQRRVRGVLLLLAGIELAIAARVGLIADGTAAKAPRTDGAERSKRRGDEAEQARCEMDTRRSKAAGRGRCPPLLDWRGSRAGVA